MNYNKLHEIIIDCKHRHLPFKRKKFNRYKHKISPWITPAILISIRHRDQLYKKKILATPDSDVYNNAKTNLTTFSIILQKTIRSAKFKYYHEKLKKFRLDSRKTWATINDILWRKKSKNEFPSCFKDKGNNITVKQEIADRFNEFFTNIGPELSKKIPSPHNLSFRNYLNKNICSVFDFHTIDNKCVTDVIKDMAPKSSCGFDEISSKLLKKYLLSFHSY